MKPYEVLMEKYELEELVTAHKRHSSDKETMLILARTNGTEFVQRINFTHKEKEVKVSKEAFSEKPSEDFFKELVDEDYEILPTVGEIPEKSLEELWRKTSLGI